MALFVLGTAVARHDIPGLCAGLTAQLAAGVTGSTVTCDVTAARADVVTVEALARLRLTARRHGRRLVLAGPGPDLVALLRLLGLADVLPQVGGEPEEREQPVDVEEVVDPGDPVA